MEALIQEINTKIEEPNGPWTTLKQKLQQFLGLMDAVVIEMQKDADRERELRARATEQEQQGHPEQQQHLQEE